MTWLNLTLFNQSTHLAKLIKSALCLFSLDKIWHENCLEFNTGVLIEDRDVCYISGHVLKSVFHEIMQIQKQKAILTEGSV